MIRRDVEESRGARDAAYIHRTVAFSALWKHVCSSPLVG